MSLADDSIVVAEFQKVYNIVYDANGGDRSSVPTDTADHYYNSGTTADNVTIPPTKPTRAGYTFLGWNTSKTSTTAKYTVGNTYTNLTSSSSITLYAVWAQYSVTFYDGNAKLSITPLTGAAGDEVTLPSYNAATKAGYSIAAWTIDGTVYEQGSKFTLPAKNVRATAVFVSIRIIKVGFDGSTPTVVDDIGTLLVNGGSVDLVESSESVAGEMRKFWIFAPKPNTTYYVSCTMKTTGADRLWMFSGLTDGSGTAVSEIRVGSVLTKDSFNARFTKKTLKPVICEYQIVSGGEEEDPVYSVTITSPASPDEGEKYITGQNIVCTVVYRGTTSWEISRATYKKYSDSGEGIASGQIDSRYISNESNTVTLPANVFDSKTIITVYIDRKSVGVSASVDAPSAVALEDVSVRNADGTERIQKAKYGDTVRIYFKIKSSAYSFDGLYFDRTKLHCTEGVDGEYHYAEYEIRDVRDHVFVVKANTAVNFDVCHWEVESETWVNNPENPWSALISINGGDWTDNRGSTVSVVLGSTVRYRLEKTPDWYFDAWFDHFEIREHPPKFDNPINMDDSGEFTLSEPLEFTARVTDVKVTYKTEVKFAYKDDESEEFIYVESPSADYVTSDPPADDVQEDPDKDSVVLTYSSGTKRVTISVDETIEDVSGNKCGFLRLEKKDSQGNWVQFGDYNSFSSITSENRELRALYDRGGERTITVDYARSVGSDRSMGTIGIREAEGDGTSITAPVGNDVTIFANPNVGYKFVGWYYDPTVETVPKYVGTENIVTIITNRNLYAVFEQDPNAIYEWEGTGDNKMMTWRSKVYVAPTPFSPSAIRIDAEDRVGRSHVVWKAEVGMMSSPDAAPTSVIPLSNMPNYEARRLPKRRPERYLQVEVQNDAEVDRIIVGTSMEGLRA